MYKYPNQSPSESFWIPQHSPLKGHRTTEHLPETADVAIIGGGLSGAATAYFLLMGSNPPKNLVVVEAREVADGATGRNGGHCRPDCYRSAHRSGLNWTKSFLKNNVFANPGYRGYKKTFGKEQAFKILRNEMETLNLTQEIIEKEGLDCDFWRGHSFDVAMTQACAYSWAAIIQEYIADGADLRGTIEFINNPKRAKEVTRCPLAYAAVRFPAASLWPYKLVLGLLQTCIHRHGLNLQTRTPVRRVTRKGTSWLVHTDRGLMVATKVVYATNAFTSTLLPEFEGKITPFRGQCAAIAPTQAYSGPLSLSHTYSFQFGPPLGVSDSLSQRPDGIMILCGGRGSASIDDLLEQNDDSVILPSISDYLKTALRGYFNGWEEETETQGVIKEWSGIMGFTPELVPYIGSLPEKEGAFICAGHSGHGMARIMTCARGLAALIKGEEWEVTGLPECFQPTPQRLTTQSVVESWKERYSETRD